jgi:hypothetical protein
MKSKPAFPGLSPTQPANFDPVSRRPPPRETLPARALALVLLLGLLAFAPGCTVLRLGSGGAGKTSVQPELVDEQIQLQRFADDFLARASQALDESAERLGTETGREEVLRLKLLLGSSLLSIVSGPNPNANLLDLVSLTMLTRLSVEDYWMKTTNGAAFEPWLEASRALESDGWELAARFLKPAQVEELRRGIQEWYERTPEVRTAFFGRPHAFASMVRTTQQKEGSVFSLVSLDPTAELEPAVREVRQSRLLAERAMYTAQRMPSLLRLQAEELVYEVTVQPAVRMALTNAAQFTDSAQRIGRAAEDLSASATQLPDWLSAERKETLATFEEQESKLRDLAAAVDRALVSGAKLSDSLNMTVTNLNALVVRLKTSNRTNSRPFDILDYAQTADKVASMAQNLNALVGAVNESAPEMQRLSQQANADVEKEIKHSFRLGLVLIAVLLAGLLLVGLLCVYFAQKLKQRHAAVRPA